MKHTEARRWLVSGTVQGVGFRVFAQRAAVSLGLHGWVRNVDDGRVEVYAIGPADKLSDMAAAMYRGPKMAEVRGVEELEEAVQKLSGFSIR